MNAKKFKIKPTSTNSIEERTSILEWLANELLSEWGLISKGWGFEWTNRKSCFGLCCCRTKTIYLSTFLLPTINDVSAEDTIKHEIAHALDFEERGKSDHSWRWKAWAIKVGAESTRTGSHDYKDALIYAAEASKYKLVCPNGHVFPSHRKRYRTVSCSICCPGRFNENFLMTQVRNY